MNVYELILEDETLQGVDCISVVGSPAMESKSIFLSEQEKIITFAKTDKEKQIILGVAMIPEKKIYRFDTETKEEFYVYFSKETVKRISELYFKNGNHLNVNLEHDENQKINGVIVESWIVEDTEKDKTKLYNIEAPVGSWVVAMKIEDTEQWNTAKEVGTGFSIEGLFSEKVNFKNEINMNIKEVAKELFSEFKTLFADQANEQVETKLEQTLTIESQSGEQVEVMVETLEADNKIWTPSDDQPLASGTYYIDEETQLVVETLGVIDRIERREKPADEVVDTFNDDVIGALKNLLQLSKDNQKEIETIKMSLQSEIESLKLELSKPAVEPIINAPIEVETTQKATTQKGRLLASIQKLKN